MKMYMKVQLKGMGVFSGEKQNRHRLPLETTNTYKNEIRSLEFAETLHLTTI